MHDVRRRPYAHLGPLRSVRRVRQQFRVFVMINEEPTPIKLVPIAVKTRDQEIAAVIDRVAEMHEHDELESIVVYTVLRNGENYMNFSSTGDNIKRVGGLTWAQHRLIAGYDAATRG